MLPISAFPQQRCSNKADNDFIAVFENMSRRFWVFPSSVPEQNEKVKWGFYATKKLNGSFEQEINNTLVTRAN